jgi:hypothetical protein
MEDTEFSLNIMYLPQVFYHAEKITLWYKRNNLNRSLLDLAGTRHYTMFHTKELQTPGFSFFNVFFYLRHIAIANG